MNGLLSMMARHGYVLTFAMLLAEAVGFPLPAAIALVAAGAAVAAHTLWGPGVLLAALAALLIGDSALFWLGRYSGWALLGFLCRLSMNPETCVLRSAESFYKRGKATLLVAKFIPGVNTMAAPLAGSMKMRFRQFLGLDSAAAVLYVLFYGGVGFLFRDFLAVMIQSIQRAGYVFSDVLIGVTILYVAYRLWLHQKSKIYEVVPRVEVGDLVRRLKSEEKSRVLIVDVRSHGYYDAGAKRIQGSIRLEPNQLVEELKTLPKDRDIFLYCT